MASWETALCPFTIDFVPDKLDEIRVAVVDGLYAVPRGGVEIGGVLFGTREDGRLLIRDFRKIETEYLTGPSFELSREDLAGLRKILEGTKFTDATVGPVGWFHSHTRSGIQLSEKDLEFHREFFPEPWQVALVLKPDKLGKVRAGYFFRQAGGVLKADTCANEFTVEPYFGEKRAPLTLISEPEREPVAEAAILEMPVAEDPVVVGRVPMEDYAARAGVPASKRILLLLLALALIAAAYGGFWAATR
jgi:proteasome lid subunit RPN8/RPN11